MDPSASAYLPLLDDLLLIGRELRATAVLLGASSLTCVHRLPGGDELVLISVDEDHAVRATLRGVELDLDVRDCR